MKKKLSAQWLAEKMGIGYKKKPLKWKNTDLKGQTNLNTQDRLLPKINIKIEISMTLQTANKCFCGLSKMFRSKATSKNLKVRIYLTLLRPISLYRTETWLLRKTEELRMAVFKRKILRKIYRAHFDAKTNEWRKLHNDELQSLFQ